MNRYEKLKEFHKKGYDLISSALELDEQAKNGKKILFYFNFTLFYFI